MIWKFALLIIAVVTGAASQTVPCPNGYENFADEGLAPVCLKFATTKKATWGEWLTMCQQDNGGHLAIVKGDLHGKIYQHIQNDQDLWDEAFWVGASDAENEGQWVWTDGTPVDMGPPHWDPCDPPQPDGGTAQNYMCLWTPNFYFSSCLNSVTIYAICQI
ncbi:hypothetical protein SK128_023498 [Halocaridina rubra]|uniref:C-type lectin domain-containing protein n=1 Tax=Halocaridina rubra TaxID=373956 RepID=A0AAN9A5F9_HALRR